MNEAMNDDQAQTCPQCGKGRKYFGVTDEGHEHGRGHGHHGHGGEKHHHKHEGHGK